MGALFFFLISVSGLGQDVASRFESASVSQVCPQSLAEWKSSRDGLIKSKALVDVLAFGETASLCSRNKDQQKFFSSQALRRCLEPVMQFSRLVVEHGNESDPLAKAVPKLPEAAFRLPAAFRDMKFWREFSSPDTSIAETALSNLEKRIPGSHTFRYRSEFEPKQDLFLTVFDEPGMRRYVHFDKDLNVNLLSVAKTKDGPRFALSTAPLKGFQLPRKMDTVRGRCLRCHEAAVVAIVPGDPSRTKWYNSSPPTKDPIGWFNSGNAQQSGTGYDGFFRGFPNVGTKARPDFDRFVSECFQTRDPLRLERFREAMNCALCHDGKTMPPITYPFGNSAFLVKQGKYSVIQLDQTIHSDLGVSPEYWGTFAVPHYFITSGHMPPDFKGIFSVEDKRRLVDCLLTDYLGGLYPRVPDAVKATKGLLMQALLKEPCP